MAEPPRYLFHPRERRGLVLGLGAGQLLGAGGGLVAAVVVHGALRGSGGVAAAVLVAAVGAGASLWSRDQRPLGEWAFIGAGWAARRARGPLLDDLPVAGPSVPRPGRPSGIRLVTDRGGPGGPAMACVVDRRAATIAGVIPVDGGSFALMDPEVQADALEGWRRVLGTLARPGSPVRRVQWLHRVGVAGPGGPAELEAGPAGPHYRRLVAATVPSMKAHRTWLVVAVGARPDDAGRRDLRREMRLLAGQLSAAGLRPGPPLDGDEMAGLLAGPSRPSGAFSSRSGRDRTGGWPLAVDDRWSMVRVEGAWHCTYWVAEWPRIPVGPDFLTPLLVGVERASLSVVMSPVDPAAALRQARSSQASDLADAQLRARAGFLPSSRRQRESDGARQLEEELTDGHCQYRFSAYLTVSADERDGLLAACAEAEHSAQAARVELRRLYGRQAEAYTWTQPLGRGLR